jgi:redox-sensing transcriptional repressor
VHEAAKLLDKKPVRKLKADPSNKTVGRLSLYRRILNRLLIENRKTLFSHELAEKAKVSPAQVRRDIMAIGYQGSPAHGYDVKDLYNAIGTFLDVPSGRYAALVGVGNLGRAILAYFDKHRADLLLAAAFDRNPDKVNRVIHSHRCYPVDRMVDIVRQYGVAVGIIAVPAEEAQSVADLLVEAGVRGILNFAPVPVEAPANIFVEDFDLTSCLEVVAFNTRKNPWKGQ